MTALPPGMAAEFKRLQAERGELLEALKPFAALAEVYDGPTSSDQLVFFVSGRALYVGQLRRARELVEALDRG